MEGFYVVYVISPNGDKGYVCMKPEGLTIAVGGVTSDITQFATFKEAKDFIRERKLEKKGLRAYIRTNQDLIDMHSAELVTYPDALYYLETEDGKKMCYDAETKQYFFANKDVGFVCYKQSDMEGLKEMAVNLTREMAVKVEIKNMQDRKKEW